ncbi:MAG: hypothetical protein ACKV2O_05840 [Acidimicrobiales bacterium]
MQAHITPPSLVLSTYYTAKHGQTLGEKMRALQALVESDKQVPQQVMQRITQEVLKPIQDNSVESVMRRVTPDVSSPPFDWNQVESEFQLRQEWQDWGAVLFDGREPNGCPLDAIIDDFMWLMSFCPPEPGDALFEDLLDQLNTIASKRKVGSSS